MANTRIDIHATTHTSVISGDLLVT